MIAFVVIGVGGFAYWYVGQVMSLSRAADRAGLQRKKAVQKLVRGSTSGQTGSKAEPARRPERVDAPMPFEKGGDSVSVRAAEVASLPSFSVVATLPPPVTPPAAPTPAPPQLSEEGKIRAEADRKWEAVEKAARSKSRAKVTDFYRREKLRIIDELSRKHRISRDELKKTAPYLFKK